MVTENVRIDKETYQNLKEEKKQNGVAIAFTIKKAVEEYLKKNK